MGRAGQKIGVAKGVRARGDSVQVDFMWRGARCRETLKLTPTPANMKFAVGLLAEVKRKIAMGTFAYAEYFPDSKRAGTSEGAKVAKLLDAFEADCERSTKLGKLSPSTLDGYKKAVRALKAQFGKLSIGELSSKVIREWVKGLDLTEKSVRNTLTPLRTIVADALNDELIEVNPFDRVALDRLLERHAKPSDYEVDPFTPAEVKAICDAASPQGRNFLLFAFHTGLRTSELVALRWEDVDWKARVVRIHRAVVENFEKGPKTSAGARKVELDATAYTALENQRQWTLLQAARVFHNPKTNKPLVSDQSVRKCIWLPAISKTTVRYRNPYQTRHTFASAHVSRGCNLYWLKDQMGHTTLEMIFRHYAKWMPEYDARPARHANA